MRTATRVLALAAIAALTVAALAAAQPNRQRQARAALSGFEEVPAISSPGTGFFRGTLSNDGLELAYQLAYDGLVDVAQAHIHLGQPGVNGGIIVFLCDTVANAIPDCPTSPGMVTGTVGPDDVIGPAAQGIDPGEWEEFLRALRAGLTYANVHTAAFPGGEIRGQIGVDQRRRRP